MPCAEADRDFALMTARQWPAVVADWRRERVAILLDDPMLDGASLACEAELVQIAVSEAIRTHQFVKRKA
jgi:hypothetical protein